MSDGFPILGESNVEARPLPTPYDKVRPDPDAFGATQQRGVHLAGEAASTISEFYLKERERANTMAVSDLDVRFSDEARGVLYGQDGFLLRQGAAALDTAPTMEKLAALRAKYLAQAQNEDQARAFSVRSASRLESLSDTISAHSNQQRLKAYADSANGQARTTLNFVRDNYDNLDKIDKALDQAKEPMTAYWSMSQGDQSVTQNWKEFEAEAFDQAMNVYYGQDHGVAAQAFLSQPGVRERLGAKAADWDRKLKPLIYKEQGEEIADAAYRLSFGRTPGVSDQPSEDFAMTAAAEMVRQRNLPWEVYDKAQAGVRSRLDQHASGYEADTKNITLAAMRQWTERGHSLRSIDQNLHDQLVERGAWHNMERIDDQWQKSTDPAREPPTALERLSALRVWEHFRASPWSFEHASVDEMQERFGGALHPDDFKMITHAILDWQGRPEKEREGIEPILRYFEVMGARNGVFPDKMDPTNPDAKDQKTWTQAEVNAYWSGQEKIAAYLREWHQGEHGAKQRVPTMEEWQSFVDKLVAKGTEGTGFMAAKTTALRAEIEGTEFTPDPRSMTAAQRSAIIRTMIEMDPDHRRPTPEQVNAKYVEAGRLLRTAPPSTRPRFEPPKFGR